MFQVTTKSYVGYNVHIYYRHGYYFYALLHTGFLHYVHLSVLARHTLLQFGVVAMAYAKCETLTNSITNKQYVSN